MNEDHHPVGRPSGESGRAEIALAKVRERMEGAQIAVVLSRREATALLERIEALEAAVAPFAAVGDIFEVRAGNRPNDDDDPITEWTDHRVGSRLITVGDFRRARKALSGEKP